ncbi:hypothetical protein, partial [Serratia plymuthica]|uniref:hypothetical protein n=1 Tax=Serratia plymuthica TaxID=82996 RepID=UPI000AE4E0DD
SDKLLKSSELAAVACYLEVAYNTLSSFRVNPNFQDFFSSNPGDSVKLFTCSVSMEAHYRELAQNDKD